MKVYKAGTILINLVEQKIGLVYRKRKNDYTFPKGHLEENETLQECAVRETEEETGRKNKLISDNEIAILEYQTPQGEDVLCYYYIAIDNGQSNVEIPEELQEELVWISLDEIEEKLTYENLKEIWKKSEEKVKEFLYNITPAKLTDIGICPTCFDKQNNNFLYGNPREKMLYEDEFIECFFVGNPRAEGHVAISSKEHYKDMMEIPEELCDYVFRFAKKTMNFIKEVYKAESVYLCTMCDGPMNHFHIQLIPRYSFEKRGSKNFVKERKEYIEDTKKLNLMRERLK